MRVKKSSVEVKDPLKQGLKLLPYPHNNNITGFVEVKDPLKQGLKLNDATENVLPQYVEVKDPLKQGLKL